MLRKRNSACSLFSFFYLARSEKLQEVLDQKILGGASETGFKGEVRPVLLEVEE